MIVKKLGTVFQWFSMGVGMMGCDRWGIKRQGVGEILPHYGTFDNFWSHFWLS